jgi:hypothetical protein
MKPYSEEALELKLSFEAGVADVAEIIQWADRTLLACDNYDDDLAELCMAKDKPKKHLISLLGKLAGPQYEEWAAMRRTMARMHRTLGQDSSRAREFAQFLELFWVRHDYQVPEDMSFMAGVHDEYQLAEEGIYGTIDQAKESLLRHLANFLGSGDELWLKCSSWCLVPGSWFLVPGSWILTSLGTRH